MSMLQTWRWYGPNDPVSLQDIKQAGAKGIVNALHEVPIGEVWSLEELLKRKKMIELDHSGSSAKSSGLIWSVIESIPVHEDIKLGKPSRDKWIKNYQESLRNVGKAGIPTVCYNFMPVVDWTRTNLEMLLQNGGKALSFDMTEFIVFDVFILKREGAEKNYQPELIEDAKKMFSEMDENKKLLLQKTIIAGLPGGQEGYTLEKFLARLNEYKNIDENKYRENLAYFLKAIIPVAEEAGVNMAIHPDDPPFSLFGLPRIVSTEKDLEYLLNIYDSVNNGYTMCTGSYGVRADNDLSGMVSRFGNKLNFIHLRSTIRDAKGSFYEADHLYGDVDMYSVISAILKEQKKRETTGTGEIHIPMRPDHGHVLLDDLHKKTNPGYSAIGRLKGLAELRGLEMGIIKSGVI